MATFKAKMKRYGEQLSANHVALMRDDVTTLQATVGGSAKLYTFKVTRDLAATLGPGDFVVASVRGEPAVVEVDTIHDHPRIDPHAQFYYRWVTMKVDKGAYFDRGLIFAKVDSRLLYAEQCEGYAEGSPVEIDCDREKAEYNGMIPTGHGGHDDLMPYVEGTGDSAQYVAFKLMIERGEI